METILAEVLKHKVYPAMGCTAEATIKNIARISSSGMAEVDRIILDIMSAKRNCCPKANNCL